MGTPQPLLLKALGAASSSHYGPEERQTLVQILVSKQSYHLTLKFHSFIS